MIEGNRKLVQAPREQAGGVILRQDDPMPKKPDVAAIQGPCTNIPEAARKVRVAA
ncbi:MAG: hypothetical protein IMF05_01305 [Proteobacteria bacterium]|nr:hypothetical protein [Pseudomonadota bacterium]